MIENLSLISAEFLSCILMVDSVLLLCDDLMHYPKLPYGTFFCQDGQIDQLAS